MGEGLVSVIMWEADSHLFQWPQTAAEVTVSNLEVLSTTYKTPESTAFYFPLGVTQSSFSYIHITNENDVDHCPGSGFRSEGVTDTVVFHQNLLWEISGTGYEIGWGSEVRILGGRVIGKAMRNDGSIGIQCTGNNGGVHIDSTDVIALQTAIQLDSTNGHGSNREIFLSHATLDSCGRGLAVMDDSYVSIAGCWAASSDNDQIWVEPGHSGALIDIVGGTIFNGGVYLTSYTSTQCLSESKCNGITVNAGSFVLNGVQIRNNKGHAVWVPNDSVSQYIISGNRFYTNGIAMNLSGSNYVATSNVCADNSDSNAFGGTNNVVDMNLNC
ncbi:Pectate lyase superfamily protein [Pelomyxa schiedti]|nr:Pectate lyase superfamily protein [Pelomyxa schiedti]